MGGEKSAGQSVILSTGECTETLTRTEAATIWESENCVHENGVGFVQMESAMTLEPNEVRVIHALFHAMLFRPALSTHILGIIQAVV